jgi:hypothetical protein
MRSNAASVNMARFPELSENDLACLLESKNSENTKKQLKCYAMNDKTIIIIIWQSNFVNYDWSICGP